MSPELSQQQRISIISEIDNFQIVKNNNFIVAEIDKAIKIARDIIALAEKGDFNTIIREEERFIAECMSGFYARERISEFKRAAEDLKIKFNIYIDDGEHLEAHNIVDTFYEKYADYLTVFKLPAVQYVLTKDKEITADLHAEKQELVNTLAHLEEQFNSSVRTGDRTGARDILDQAWDLLFQLNDRELQRKWAEMENNFLDGITPKREDDQSALIQEIETVLVESHALCKDLRYREAILRLETRLRSIEDMGLSDYEKKLEIRLQEVRQEGDKQFVFNTKLTEYDLNLKSHLENGNYDLALKDCEDIVSLCKDYDKEDISNDYERICEQIKIEIESEKEVEPIIEPKEDLLQKAKQIENVIEIEENVLPIIEDFAVSDLLGDLSDDLDEMLNQVGSLLDEHRVEIKEEGSSKTKIRSASGEVQEIESKREIQQNDDNEKGVSSRMQSGLINPFNDVIEEAIINDIIPFNYEITEVELNGNPIKEIPNKTLTRDGLEIQWELKNIPPREKVEIGYNLRRRISRTIIFILEGQLKIIKTHTNLNKLQIDGLFDAFLPFTNSFGVNLNGLVLEDIIPLYYIHFILSPDKNSPAKVEKATQGELIKWNIGEMEQKTLNYHYKLLELYKLEELKVTVSNLTKEGIDAIKKEDIDITKSKYKDIVSLLSNYYS